MTNKFKKKPELWISKPGSKNDGGDWMWGAVTVLLLFFLTIGAIVLIGDSSEEMSFYEDISTFSEPVEK